MAGKLHVEVSKIGGAVLDRYVDMTSENYSDETVPMGAPLAVKVSVTINYVLNIWQFVVLANAPCIINI